MTAIQRPVAAVIFDLDGTLADTIPLIVDAWNAAVREPLGRAYSYDEVVSRFGIPDAAMLKRELPEAAWQRAIETYYHHYETAHDCVVPFDGIPELLQALQKQGLPLGVMTGKGRRTADVTLSLLGWEKVFYSIVTGEDVAQQKPAPDGVLRVAREIGAEPSQCIYVGDSPADIKAGKAAQMFTVAAAWHTYYHDRLRACEPDYWAAHPQDVLKLVETSG